MLTRIRLSGSSFNRYLKLCLWLVLAAGLLLPGRASADEPQVFLPLLVRATGVTPPPPPPPPPAQGAFFADHTRKIGSASIAVDKDGGLHLAYAHYTPFTEQPVAVYKYCPPDADCTQSTNWQGVNLGNLVTEVQLALTPAGQPRLLFQTGSGVYNPALDRDYYYAACDQNCTTFNGWQTTYILSSSGGTAVTDLVTPQRSFALDPQGRPRFVYWDGNYAYAEPDHYGGYYVYCDSDCNQSGNWYQTRITQEAGYKYEIIYYPSLTFTSQGQPRMLAYLVPLGGIGNGDGIYYFACDSNCENGDNWERVGLYPRGSGSAASWDLELDGNNRPRFVFYQGEGSSSGDKLYYIWCNSNCLNFAGWDNVEVGLGLNHGQHPDLEIDNQGKPRIAYLMTDGGGTGYSWCSGNCESAQGQWQHKVLETTTLWDAAFPVPMPPHCDTGLWDGIAPVLALNPAGQPRLAHDVAYSGRCWYDDPTDNLPGHWEDWSLQHSVRVVLFPHP